MVHRVCVKVISVNPSIASPTAGAPLQSSSCLPQILPPAPHPPAGALGEDADALCGGGVADGALRLS